MRRKAITFSGMTVSRSVLMMLVAVILATGVALATEPMNKLSPEYNAGFAFFKYAKATPNYELWVKSSERYKNATPRERVIMLRSEVPMLEGYFNAYAPQENPIDVKVRVKFKAPSTKAVNTMLTEQGFVTIPMKIIGQKEDFFPIQVADMWIAMIPGNMEEVLTLIFEKDEYETFVRQAAGTTLLGTNAEAMLHLSLLPTGADTKNPMQVDGFNLWMLGVRLIDMELWDSKDERMAWYIAGRGSKTRLRNDKVFNLYEN